MVLYALATVWVVRVPFPYDLEWMEGGMLAHAWRVQQGLPLYGEPGPEFIPFVYPPGFAVLLAHLGSLTELGYTLGRVLSLTGAVAAAAAIVFVVRREHPSWGPPIAAAVAFLACYPGSGAFYDLVRPDGMFIGLLAWAIALGLVQRRGAAEAAGLVLCLAFIFKHNAAIFLSLIHI